MRTQMNITLLCTLLLSSIVSADVVTYSGPRDATRDQFNIDSDGLALLENFDSFVGESVVGDLPANGARFAPEYADGSVAPLPVTQPFAGAPSGSQWMKNFGNGRPASSAWVIRPDNENDLIYAFGQVNAQGDWVRIEGFDADDNLIVSVDAQPIVAGCFAGFIVREGVSKVVVTPLGNFDGLNGMDDVQVATTPIDLCDVDLNCDGDLDIFDVIEFIEAFNAEDPRADFLPNGVFDIFDVIEYIRQFEEGCPS